MAVIEHGRICYSDKFKICLPLFAAMSLPREIQSRREYQTCSNMSERINYDANYVPMNGKCLHEVATPQQIAQLMIVAENKITLDENDIPQWNIEEKERKYTPASARTKSGGWNQLGLTRYHHLLEREKQERKELNESFKNNPQDRPDYLNYPRLEGKKGRKRKAIQLPDAEDVLVGIEEDDLNLLGEDSSSETESEFKKEEIIATEVAPV